MRKTAEYFLYRLWGADWEAWKIPRKEPASAALLLDSRQEPGTAEDGILALPTRSVVALPLWIDSVDEEIIRGTLDLELEVRGLQAQKDVSEALVIRSYHEEGRTLALCAIFPTEPPLPAVRTKLGRYEVSPLLFKLDPDSISLWQEGSDLAVAITRGEEPIWWGTCEMSASLEEVGAWLVGLQLQLAGYRIIGDFALKVVLAPELSERFLGRICGFATEVGNFKPDISRARYLWKPQWLREEESTKARGRKASRWIWTIAAVCLALVAAAGAHLAYQFSQLSKLKADVSALEAEVEIFQPTVRQWNQIGPSVDADQYPLEALMGVVESLPKDGIRLTVYDLEEGKVTIEGEATTASIASQFFTKITNAESLRRYRWEMPAPSLLPNSSARFQIEGVIR